MIDPVANWADTRVLFDQMTLSIAQDLIGELRKWRELPDYIWKHLIVQIYTKLKLYDLLVMKNGELIWEKRLI